MSESQQKASGNSGATGWLPFAATTQTAQPQTAPQNFDLASIIGQIVQIAAPMITPIAASMLSAQPQRPSLAPQAAVPPPSPPLPPFVGGVPQYPAVGAPQPYPQQYPQPYPAQGVYPGGYAARPLPPVFDMLPIYRPPMPPVPAMPLPRPVAPIQLPARPAPPPPQAHPAPQQHPAPAPSGGGGGGPNLNDVLNTVGDVAKTVGPILGTVLACLAAQPQFTAQAAAPGVSPQGFDLGQLVQQIAGQAAQALPGLIMALLSANPQLAGLQNAPSSTATR